jgi:hypothetical protein
MIDLSDVTLDFPCPYCRHKFYKTIGWVEINSRVTCPVCGMNIHLHTSELRNDLQTARAAIAKFRGGIKPQRHRPLSNTE